MKAIVLTLIVLYLLAAFVACLDRGCAVESGGDGKEDKSNEFFVANFRRSRRDVFVDRNMANAEPITSSFRLAAANGDHGRRADN